METRFFIDLHGQLLQRQTVPMSSRRNSGMLSQVQKGRGENSDNNPCDLYNWGDFCTGPEGVLSTVLQCTTFLLLLLLFFFSLLTNSLEKISNKTKLFRSWIFFFSLLPTVWFLTFYSHITTTHKLPHYQLHRSVVKQRNSVPIFDHPGSLGHINMSRQNPRHLQQKTTTTHNTQHTKINYKNK